jgi:poly(A) polymerase
MFSALPQHTVPAIALRLKLPNDEQRHIYDMLAMQTRISVVTEHTSLDVLKKLMREKYFPDALKLYGMRIHAGDNAVEHHPQPFGLLTKLYAGMKQEDLHPEKFVTGNDLIALGLKPGKRFKEILDHIENAQLRGEIHSKAQAIAMVHSMK